MRNNLTRKEFRNQLLRFLKLSLALRRDNDSNVILTKKFPYKEWIDCVSCIYNRAERMMPPYPVLCTLPTYHQIDVVWIQKNKNNITGWVCTSHEFLKEQEDLKA